MRPEVSHWEEELGLETALRGRGQGARSSLTAVCYKAARGQPRPGYPVPQTRLPAGPSMLGSRPQILMIPQTVVAQGLHKPLQPALLQGSLSTAQTPGLGLTLWLTTPPGQLLPGPELALHP